MRDRERSERVERVFKALCNGYITFNEYRREIKKVFK
jgi:hypothetical protein